MCQHKVFVLYVSNVAHDGNVHGTGPHQQQLVITASSVGCTVLLP